MSGQQATITRADTTGARYSTVRMLVPWSQGDQTSIATIRNTRAVQVGNTTYPTRWRVRGAPHNDGSIRFTYAEWWMEVANGNLASGAPTHTATVVATDNSATGAASFAAWADQLNITIAYTSETGSSVSTDIAARARAGTDGSIYTVSDEGGTRFIHYETWIGPGRRHSPKRSAYATYGNTRGPSVGNNPVVRQGLLHIVCKIEVRDQEDHILVELNIRNDAAYPYPSAPPDGGERLAGRPDRPTHLNPAEVNPIVAASPGSWQGPSNPGNLEVLESRLFRQFQSGITVTISHGSTTVYSRPFYVSNHTTGAGPWGTITSTGNGTTHIQTLLGLQDAGGWGIRFAVSDVSVAEAEFWASPACMGWIAVPTYATWLATDRSRTFVGGEVNGDTITRLGFDFALLETIPAATLTAWRLRGHSASEVNFMSRTHASPYRLLPDGYGDFVEDPSRGGKHFAAGLLHHGEAVLAGSPEFLYKMGGLSLRVHTMRPEQIEPECLETLDILTDTAGDDRYTHYFFGTNLQNNNRIKFGRQQGGELGNSPLNTITNWNGAPAVRTNPDPAPITADDGPTWGAYSPTHYGHPVLFQHALLTDSGMDRYLLRVWANILLLNYHRQHFYGSNPANHASRGEIRPQWALWHSWVLSDDTTWRTRIRSTICARMAAWLNSASRAYWRAVGRSGDGKDTDRGSACGIPPYTTIIGTNMMQWWLIGQLAEQAMNWAMDADTDANAREIATAVMYMTRFTVDNGFWCDPASIPQVAHRAWDTSCFASNAARFTGQAYPSEGYLCPKHSLITTASSTATTAVLPNIHADVGVSNDAQVAQQWPCLPLSMVFAANRARAGHTERVAFLRAAVQARFPELQNGQSYSDTPTQHLGFATGDSYRPATQGPGPSATFTVSTRAGIIPLAVTLDPAASVINGNTAVATYRWWDHYLVGATPSATGTGVPSSRVVTYNGPGVFRPALEITQEDGQISLYVDGPGIDARPAIIPAPSPRFSASPSSILTGQGDTVQFTYAEFGGRAETYVWEYRIESPGPGAWTAFGSGARDPIWPDPGVAGTYSFRVTAANITGSATHTETSLIRVDAPTPPPNAVFTPSVTLGTAPLAVTLDGSATTFSGAAASVEWAWWANYNPATAADSTVVGTAGSTYSPTYSVPGTFYPGLQVTQADGQQHRYVFTAGILVNATPRVGPPDPDFAVGATGLEVAESIACTYIDRGVFPAVAWLWEFKHEDDTDWTTFSEQRAAIFVAEESGLYSIRVTATSGSGDSATKTYTDLVTVAAPTPPPQATFSYTPASGQYPLTVNFNAAASTVNGNAAAAVWHWYKDTGDENPTQSITGAGGSTWQYEYTLPGVYYPKLRLVQEDGQESIFVDTVGIVVTTDPANDPPEGTITIDDATAEPGQDLVVTWTDSGVVATSHVWYYSVAGANDWIEFSQRNPAILKGPTVAGSYDVRCEATNQNGTTTVDAEDLFTVAAGSLPVAAFTLSKYRFDRDAPSYPQPFLTVTDASTNAESWSWRVDPVGATFTGQTPPTFQLPGLGTHRITLTVRNAYGESTAFKYATVLPRAALTGDIGSQADGITIEGEIGPEI